MTTPWLSVVGIGEDGIDGLAPAARTLVADAVILIGGKRHLAMLSESPDDNRERIAWPSPMTDLLEKISAMAGRRVCVLATGDPNFYGVAATLARHVDPAETVVVPGISAFSLAAARLGWALERTALVSLHGRPLDTLALHVAPGARLLLLAEDSATPGAVAAWLSARGFGASRLMALAHMGGERETRHEATAETWDAAVPDFHTLAVECVAGPEADWHARVPGLPDEAFRHDGKMTKREARALAVAKLRPARGALLWDIGAGAGSVAIEWLRAAEFSEAIALEPDPTRRAFAAANASALGVAHLDIRDARAPEGLADLPQPDAIFVGGGVSIPAISTSLSALRPGGTLVAHAVTLESEAVLLDAYARHGGELVRISVARAEKIGDFTGWRPAMPVTQWSLTKGAGAARLIGPGASA